jgi:hypothetical protein
VLTRLGDEPLYRYSFYTRLALQVTALRGAETCLTNRTARLASRLGRCLIGGLLPPAVGTQKLQTTVIFLIAVDRFHDSALHGDRCTAGCEANTNFAYESACLMADNVLNEGN